MTDPLLVFDRAMIGHDPGPHHPESPQRLRAIEAALAGSRSLSGIALESPAEASPNVITRVHTSAHVDRLLALRNEEATLDPDTYVSPGSIRAALLAAGAATMAVDALCTGEAPSAFAFVRPPGHHAEAERAMGFCLFNNIAIAAAHARVVHGIERTLIIDWDVHHGNGTQAIFYDDPSVLFCSIHQSPLYPGSGAAREAGTGAGIGHTVNIPLGGGAHDADFLRAFEAVIAPIAEQYAPQLVLVSAGFDAHRDDPIGGMMLTDDGFAALCGGAQEIANRSANGRLGLLLEGGYNMDALADSALACARVLIGETPPACPQPTSAVGERGIAGAVAEQRAFWKL